MVGREPVLELLHDGHPGISKTKLIARQVVWWPGIDTDIANKVQHCQECQLAQKSWEITPIGMP